MARRIWVPLTLLIFLSLACNFSYSIGTGNATATPQPTPDPGRVITSITLAKGASGDLKVPVNPTKVFLPSDVIHAVVALKEASDNTQVTARWAVVNVGKAARPNSVIGSFNQTTNGTRNLDFILTPTRPWPVGIYRVEISINGKRVKTVEYRVK